MVDRLGLLDGLSLHLKICGGIAVGCGDTGLPKPLANCEDVDPGSQQMYHGAMAHAVGVQALARQCGSYRLSSCAVFPKDVADAEAGEARASMVTEEWIFGKWAGAPFRQQRTEDFGRLWPQWANTFLASLAKQANVRRGLEAHVKHAHRDDFVNPCACIEHRRKQCVITTTVRCGPVNCAQYRLDFIEFEVFNRTGTRSLERHCQNPLT